MWWLQLNEGGAALLEKVHVGLEDGLLTIHGRAPRVREDDGSLTVGEEVARVPVCAYRAVFTGDGLPGLRGVTYSGGQLFVERTADGRPTLLKTRPATTDELRRLSEALAQAGRAAFEAILHFHPALAAFGPRPLSPMVSMVLPAPGDSDDALKPAGLGVGVDVILPHALPDAVGLPGYVDALKSIESFRVTDRQTGLDMVLMCWPWAAFRTE
jgi:hypothetical protein